MSDDATSLGRCNCTRETEAAVLVMLEDLTEKWIPKSVIHDDSEVFGQGMDGEMFVKTWWAEKEGL